MKACPIISRHLDLCRERTIALKSLQGMRSAMTFDNFSLEMPSTNQREKENWLQERKYHIPVGNLDLLIKVIPFEIEI